MRLYLSVVLFLILGAACAGDDGGASFDLPAMETFVTEPTIIENVSIWVPAARSGPFINRACVIKENLGFSLVLPASINHQKTGSCPDQTARILAELSSFYHYQSLPLTIFNGWQWEYTYSMCQYESVSYELPRRGGSWENGWDLAVGACSCWPV